MDMPRDINATWTGMDAIRPLLRYANFYDAAPGGEFGPRYIADYQLLFVQSGEGAAMVGDETFNLFAGDIVFYGPNIRHRVVSSTRSPLRLLGLHFLFDSDTLNRTGLPHSGSISDSPFACANVALACPLAPVPPPWVRPTSSAEFRARFEAIVLNYVASSTSRAMEKQGLMLLLFEAWHDILCQEPSSQSRPPLVDRAVALIAADLTGAHSTESLAADLHISADTFGRLFRRHTGVTVREYIRSCRLTEARKLLVEGRNNVAEVARAVGYEDAFYFSRVFHAAYGVSPSAFRKKFPIS
jgi:AraC-like DNA-binding protein